MLSQYRIVHAERFDRSRDETRVYEIQRRAFPGIFPLLWRWDFLHWAETLQEAELLVRADALERAQPERLPGIFATYAKDGTRIAPPESAGPLREGMGVEAEGGE